MNSVSVVQISLELCCAVFVFMAFVTVLIQYPENRRTNNRLAWMLGTIFFQLIADVGAIYFRSDPSTLGWFMVRLCNYFVFAAVPLLAAFVSSYVVSISDNTENGSDMTFPKIIFAICAVHLALIVISQFTDLIYYFDETNTYHRNPGFILPSALAAVETVLLGWRIIWLRKSILRSEVVSIMVFILMPFVTNIYQFFFYGLSLNNLASAFSVMIIFFNHQIEKSRKLIRQTNQLLRQQEKINIQEREIIDKNIRLSISQIRPHFIFNALGSIEQLCKRDPAAAAEATHVFAKYLRVNLRAMGDSELVPVKVELEHIRSYIWLEKMRFGDDINFIVDLKADDFYLPALTIQPLVENAVKHGMMGLEEGQITIRFSTYEMDDSYVVVVSDNGCGFDVDNYRAHIRDHVGLSNVSDRVSMMTGGRLEIRSYIGAGTEITVTIPKTSEPEESEENA